MNEDLKHLKEKKDFGYGDAIRITGAALALMLQIYYKRIAEDTAYNMFLFYLPLLHHPFLIASILARTRSSTV